MNPVILTDQPIDSPKNEEIIITFFRNGKLKTSLLSQKILTISGVILGGVGILLFLFGFQDMDWILAGVGLGLIVLFGITLIIIKFFFSQKKIWRKAEGIVLQDTISKDFIDKRAEYLFEKRKAALQKELNEISKDDFVVPATNALLSSIVC